MAQAVLRDEEAILWREMQKIPEIYREPLILFYRQHRSIEHVAVALDLSEDVVRQRLSRGRKLLHEQVLAFVESTLTRTNPGPTFASGAVSYTHLDVYKRQLQHIYFSPSPGCHHKALHG